MGSIAKLVLFLMVCCSSFGQMHKHWLIAPNQSVSSPIPLNQLVIWVDVIFGGTNTTGGGTNSSGISPPSDGDSIKGWKSRADTDRFGIAGAGQYPVYLSTGGTSNRSCLRMTVNNNCQLHLDSSTEVFNQPITYFMVMKLNLDSGCIMGVDGLPQTQNDYDNNGSRIRTWINAGSTLVGANSITANTWFLLTVRLDGVNSFIRTNGVQYVAGDAGTQAMTGVKIGQQYGLGKVMNGYVAECIIYSNAVSVTAIESYLMQKHGLP